MLNGGFIVIYFVQPHHILIVFFDRYFELLTAGFLRSHIFFVLQSAGELGVAVFSMKGQFDVDNNGGHLCVPYFWQWVLVALRYFEPQ